MGIKVKHGVKAAAIGGSAYTVGRGQRIERDYRFNTEVGLKQQGLDIQAASVGNQAKARADATAQRDRESERNYDLRQDELGFRKQQWEDEPARQLEQGLQQQKILQSKVSLQYDEGQKREMAKVTTGIGWLRNQVSSGKWTAEQAEQAEAQLWKKYHSIIPLPVYDDTATAQERYESNIVTDRTTGAQYRMNEKGGFEPVGIGFKEYADLRAEAVKAFTSIDANGNSVVDHKKAKEFADETMRDYATIQGLAARAEEIGFRKKTIQEQRDQEQQTQQQNAEKNMGISPERAERVLKLKQEYEAAKTEKEREKKQLELEKEPESKEDFIQRIQSMTNKARAKKYYDEWIKKWK